MRKIDLVDQVFGHLTVLNETRIQNKQTYYLCKCDCGNIKEVRGDALRSGATISCGCIREETRKEFGERVSKKFVFDGKEYTAQTFCAEFKIPVSTFYKRRARGISLEKMVKMK